MDLKQINSVGLAEACKPILRVKDMEKDKLYQIVGIKSVDTSYGKSVVVETESHIIYLPKRLVEVLDDQAIADLRSCKLAVVYRGVKDVGKANSAALIEFLKI